ncbi:hypothetical protein CFOL_v3_26440 [Cephalotus follicularis]|uniref:Uncharacterized protein n=1 Tax=Cephalotus follicularis TaxID=3775 RepID=A0A1Q3CRW6_CEPFO|nr:hypothetical protein CFOL_v3_26440 [Cephalotus follicularis]
MSISSIFSSQILLAPNSSSSTMLFTHTQTKSTPIVGGGGHGVGGLVVECSSRPQKKATTHHLKTRPRKTQPWDVKRKPTVYAPLPLLPLDWTLVASDGNSIEAVANATAKVVMSALTSGFDDSRHEVCGLVIFCLILKWVFVFGFGGLGFCGFDFDGLGALMVDVCLESGMAVA